MRLSFFVCFIGMLMSVGAVCTAFAHGAASEPASKTQARVQLLAPGSDALRESLRLEGFDVLPAMSSRNPVQLVVSVAEQDLLARMGLDFAVLDQSRPLVGNRSAVEAAAVSAGYPTLEEVLAKLKAAEAESPELARVVNLTQTFGGTATAEGRDLFGIKVSDNVDIDEDEPAFLLLTGMHAREIVTPVIALHALSQLLEAYDRDPAVRRYVDENEIWIVPVANPDGYEYVFSTDNYWRKNRRVFDDGVGVDLNRNYAVGWDTACGGSTRTRSNTFRGPEPGSEPTTQTLLLMGDAKRFAKVIDFHSYGREVLWGYRCLSHPFDAFLQAEAEAMARTAGYRTRRPTATGEHYQFHLNQLSHAFLVETQTQFQPSYGAALEEAARVWPATRWLLERPFSMRGWVRDACTGAPLQASLAFRDVAFENGESWLTTGPGGGFWSVLPTGDYHVDVAAVGYEPQTLPLVIGRGGEGDVEVQVLLAPSDSRTRCS